LKNHYNNNVGARIPRPSVSITDPGGENPPLRCRRILFSKAMEIPLLAELKNKCAPKTMNISLPTEPKGFRLTSFVECLLHDPESSGHYSDGDQMQAN